MFNDIIKNAKAFSSNTLILTTITRIEGELAESEMWKHIIKEFYMSGDPNLKIMGSIINATISQRRCVFNFSRDSLRKLIENDMNFSNFGTSPPKFDNGKYRTIIKFACEIEFMKLLKTGSGRNGASVYEIIQPDVLKFIALNSVELEKQRSECLTFSTGYKLPDGKSDGVSSTEAGVHSTKDEVDFDNLDSRINYILNIDDKVSCLAEATPVRDNFLVKGKMSHEQAKKLLFGLLDRGCISARNLYPYCKYLNAQDSDVKILRLCFVDVGPITEIYSELEKQCAENQDSSVLKTLSLDSSISLRKREIISGRKMENAS